MLIYGIHHHQPSRLLWMALACMLHRPAARVKTNEPMKHHQTEANVLFRYELPAASVCLAAAAVAAGVTAFAPVLE